jgi:hypothetical protein
MKPGDAIIELLHEYDEKGFIDELEVKLWPEKICLTSDTGESSVLDHYDRFQTWADDSGVSLEPAFIRRERTPLVSDDSDTVLVLPVLCLAIRVDGELVCVAPHSTETTAYTVKDALADIESLPRGTPPEDVSKFPPDHPLRSTAITHLRGFSNPHRQRGDHSTVRELP